MINMPNENICFGFYKLDFLVSYSKITILFLKKTLQLHWSGSKPVSM